MRKAHPVVSMVTLLFTLGTLGCADVSRTPSVPATTTPATTIASTTPPAAPPRVTVDPENRSLGIIGFSEEAVAEFVVRNEGGAPLSLRAAQLSRATRVEGLVPVLPPGESVRVRFLIDTLDADGNRVQAWTLVTNDPERPQLILRTEIDVRPFLVIRPGYARYITVQHAREGTIAQTIGATDGATFRVLKVESPTPMLRVSFHEASPQERNASMAGSQWRVESTLASDSPVGPLTGYIVAHTDHPRQKRAFIAVSGFVRPILAATPPEAKVGDLPRRRPSPLHVLLKNFAEEEFEVIGASTDVAAVRVEVQPIEPGRTWRVQLHPVPDAPLGPFQGKVVVHTANPQVPDFEIPLSGRLVE